MRGPIIGPIRGPIGEMPKCGGMAGGGYIIGEGPIAGPITDCTPGTWLYAPQRPHTTLGAPLGTTRVVWHPKQPR